MILSNEVRSLLLDAIEKNRGSSNSIVCNSCHTPILIVRDERGRALKASCTCGKFNTSFRPI
jgi:hypothetical protein